MSTLAPTLEAFFTDRLARQRGASAHTIEAYRDTLRLLLRYAQTTSGIQPSQLDIADLDASMITGFLHHLETGRGNSVRTLNARLAAIHSLFRYAALNHPEHAAVIQRVLAIPAKRHDRAIVTFLTPPEIDALLAAPDTTTWRGRRDHALLLVAIQCGLRVSELTSLTHAEVRLGTGAHVSCLGKGRKHRVTPLNATTAATLKSWRDEQPHPPEDPLFTTTAGRPLSSDAVAKLVTKHSKTAQITCPSMREKRVTPHTLRHTCAMQLLHAGVDTTVIALWLGHERIDTTAIYLHADLTIKEEALNRTTPINTAPRRYHPPDDLLAFLESL